MSEMHIKKYCKLSKECDEVLKSYYEKADYSLLTKFDSRVMDRIKTFIK